MARRTDSITFDDAISAVMSQLLPIHAAVTLDWLVDAVTASAEQILGAAYAFVYFEEQDGRLERKNPASELRRRTLQRAIDAFGKDAFGAKLDPRRLPTLAEALDSGAPISATAAAVLSGVANEATASAAQKHLGVAAVSVAPMQSAGERVGTLILLLNREPDASQLKLFADHVACAVVNLRQTVAARESGSIDVVRSVFDARKLESELQRELARAERYHREVSIAVIEATNLRLLRERFGAFLTDRLLQRLGGVLAQNSRDIDVIGAYKESGYTMILTEATPDGALLAAERLLALARGTAIEGDSVPELELHLAMGWASSPNDGSTTDALFAATERRMYGLESEVA